MYYFNKSSTRAFCPCTLIAFLLTLTLILPVTAQDDNSVPDRPEWTDIGNSPSIRSESNTIVYEGKMYIFPGFGFAGAINNSVEMYDPVSNIWTNLDTMPLRDDGTTSAVTHYGIVLVGDDVWLMGGRLADHPGRVTDEVYIYNIPTDTWRRGTPLPERTGGGGAGRIGNKIHLVGGFDSGAAYDVDAHWVYDLDEPEFGWQDWRPRSPLPMKRNHFGAVVINGKLYVVGGQNDHDRGQSGSNGNLLHAYDGLTDTWTRLADLPGVQSHAEGGTFAIDGKIYMFSGQERDPQAVRYDPTTDTWTDMVDYKLPLWLVAANARVFGEQIFVVNGGERTTSYAQSTLWAKNFPRVPLKALSFNTSSLSVEITPGDSLETEAILSNLLGEQATAYSLHLDSLPEWLQISTTTTSVRESDTEVNLSINASSLDTGTYEFTLRASATDYQTAELSIQLTVRNSEEEEEETDDGPFAQFLEAECAEVGANWLTKLDVNASGRSYVTVRPGLEAKRSAPESIPENLVSFSVEVPSADNYHLFAQIATRNSNDDSFYVRIDGGRWKRWYRGLVTDGFYLWKEVIASPYSLSAGSHQIDFAFREDGAKLDKLLLTLATMPPLDQGEVASNCEPVTPTPPTTPPVFSQSLEAECGIVGGNWIVENSSAASGGAYVVITPGLNAKRRAPQDVPENRLSYYFEVPAQDSFKLLARIKAKNTNDDSFYVRVDGGRWQRWWRGLVTGDAYAWKEVIGSPYLLTPGEHRVDIAYREDGAILDKLLLTLAEEPPVDFGPIAVNCESSLPLSAEATDKVANTPARLIGDGDSQRIPQALTPSDANKVPLTEPSLHLFPNPARDLIFVDLKNYMGGKVRLTITDLTGRAHFQQRFTPGMIVELPVNHLPAGSFILWVSNGENIVSRRRFIVR